MMRLDPEMIYRLEVAGPLQPEDGSTAPPRHLFWEMTRATLDGPRIKARSAMTGIDWFVPQDDGFGKPHVRLPFKTDDGALVLLEYSGVVHASATFTRAVEQDLATGWDDQYMRMALYFETTSARYRWLAEHLFIARGRLTAAKSIEYEVFRVS